MTFGHPHPVLLLLIVWSVVYASCQIDTKSNLTVGVKAATFSLCSLYAH